MSDNKDGFIRFCIFTLIVILWVGTGIVYYPKHGPISLHGYLFGFIGATVLFLTERKP